MQRPGYRPDVDGLRAVAILAVVGYHAFPEFVPGGFVGVDVFFVISGFLITSLIAKSLDAYSFSLSEFYFRRARRILPAVIVLLVACVLFGYVVLLPDELTSLSHHVAAAAGFVSNILLWHEDGYFAPASEVKPLLHLWSLGIEEQFYLVWPVLLLLLWRWRARSIWLTVALLVAGSFALNAVLVYIKPHGTFYAPFTRFWELGLGCLLAFATAGKTSQVRLSNYPFIRSVASLLPTPHALSAIGLTLIVGSVCAFDETMRFPGWRCLLPTIGTVCMIAAGPDAWINRRILSLPAVIGIGLISYSLYLWHWPLLSYANILAAGLPPPEIRVGAVALAFALAWASYRFIETPVRRRRSPRVSLALVGGLAGIAAVALALPLLGFLGRSAEYEVRMLERGPRSDTVCPEVFGEKQTFGYCRSNRLETPELLVLGDSQGQAIYDGIVAHLGERHSIMLLAEPACPPLLNVDVWEPDADPTLRNNCRTHWDAFVDFVQRAKPTAVVLVGRGSYYLENHAFALGVEGSTAEERRETFARGFRDLVRELQPQTNVAYVLANPSFDSTPHCFMRPVVMMSSERCRPVVERGTEERRTASYRDLMRELAVELPQLAIVDTFPSLCDARFCYQQPPGHEVLYSDTFHLNPEGGRHVVATSGLLRELEDVIQRPRPANASFGTPDRTLGAPLLRTLPMQLQTD